MDSPVALIQVIAFLDLVAAGMIVPQLSSQMRVLGGGHILVGFMGSLYSGFQLISSPVTGSLSDLKGRLNVMVVCLSLSGVAYTMLGVTNSVLLFLVLRAFLGITKHTQLLTKALTPDYVKDEQELSHVFGRLSTLRQAGMAVGPIIGGHIVESFPDNGFTIIAFLVGAIFALNSGLVRRLPKVEKEIKKKEKDQPAIAPIVKNTLANNFNESVQQFYQIDWNKYREVFSFRLLLALCVKLYIANYVLFLRTKHGASPATTGYIIALFSTVAAVTSYFIKHLNNYYPTDKDFTERNFHVFASVTLSLLGLAIAPNVSMYVAFIIPLSVFSTFGNLITHEVILNKTDSDQRGTVLGVTYNIKSLAGVIAPLTAGVIAHFAGVIQVVYVAIVLAGVGTYKSYFIRTESTKENEKTKKKK